MPLPIAIDRLTIGRITLDPAILGDTVEASLAGSVSLIGRDLQAALDLHRTDGIPGSLEFRFGLSGTPPVLTLRPRETPVDDGVGTVCLYEVNYSGFAGVIRRNQPLDLTSLFVGLDVAVCAARRHRQHLGLHGHVLLTDRSEEHRLNSSHFVPSRMPSSA